jgi:heat shock protein HspQ
LKDEVERKVASLVLSGKKVRDEVLQYEGIVFDFHYSKKKSIVFV